MRSIFAGLLFGFIFGSGAVFAEEFPDSRCLTLANQFSTDPDSLSLQELERLRFCVHKTLEHREQNLKGEILKGTIIDPPSQSGKLPDTRHLTDQKNSEVIP